MKRITYIYESCKTSIRVAFFGFLLVAFGYLVQNESVNIFYTFKNTFLLLFAEGTLKLGTAIIANLPLIFMLNIVCKRANSGYPIILAMVGYLSYLIASMLIAPNTLASTAYSNGLGINSILSMNSNILFANSSGTRYPLETGLIGSFIVGYITRLSFIRSRHRGQFSVLGFLNKDSAGIIYNIVFCTLAGMAMAYVWPTCFSYLQKLITYIGKDLMDPLRIAIYGIADRILSILSLNSIIRQPFWYTAAGGSYQTISGQSIIGDVNIWNYVKDITSTFVGAGRFITPYYVINMFMIPSIYIGILFSMSDKQQRLRLLVPILSACGLSIVCGNPLPLELVLLFTSPLLLVFYLLIAGGVFYYLSYAGIYLGSNIISNSIVTAMPGNFPDFIINIRNATYTSTIGKIALIGLIAGAVCFLFTILYYRILAYDIANTGKTKELASKIVDACGGRDNVVSCGSGLFMIVINLQDQERVNYNILSQLNIRNINETKEGIEIKCGSSSYIVANRISKITAYKPAK